MYIALLAFKSVFQVKGADVGRANKHGIFIAANLYIVAVDFSSLSAQSGVCFILNKKKDTCRLSKDFASSDCIGYDLEKHRATIVAASICDIPYYSVYLIILRLRSSSHKVYMKHENFTTVKNKDKRTLLPM